jgi:large subunit ribosomal protein L5e
LISITLITFLIQGAFDGGLDIPHSEKRFAGFSKEDKSLNAETHCKYILGGHIADYMKLLKEEEPEKYQADFSGLLKEGLEADDLAEMYNSVHAAIRADPTAQLTEKNAPTEKKM